MKTLCLFLALGWAVASSARAQPAPPPPPQAPHSPAPNPTTSLSVNLWLPEADRPIHAPAAVSIFANVRSSLPAREGDTLPVQYYAGTNLIGSGTVLWRRGIQPDPHLNKPRPGVVLTAGFIPSQFVWTNIPAGSYVLTAKVTGNKASAVSDPFRLTILP